MKTRPFSLIATPPGGAIFLLLLTFSFLPGRAAALPPGDGDWTISGQEAVADQSIVLNGDLIVEAGGSLSLRNVGLTLNSPDDAPRTILIEPQGALFIEECDLSTTSPGGFYFKIGEPSLTVDLPSPSLTIRNSSFSGVNGLEMCHTQNALIEGNTLQVNSPTGLSYCLFLMDCLNCTVADNTIAVNPPVSTGSSQPPVYAISLHESHHNTILGNQSADCRNGIGLGYSWNNRVAGNTCVGPIGEPNLRDLVPRWWCVSTAERGGEAGLFLGAGAHNNLVENNTFLLSHTSIMSVCQASHNTLAHNTAKGAGLGLSLLWASENIIDGNELADVFREDAIHVYRSENNHIINNRIDTVSGGVGLFSSTGNVVQGNAITEAGRGIFVMDSTGNAIVNNDVSASAMPVAVVGSSSNTIQNNNFPQDGRQRFDDREDNDWQGNYWGPGVSGAYAIPPSGVDGSPSPTPLSILEVDRPEREDLAFEAPEYREAVIDSDQVWQNQTVTLSEGLSIESGGSLTMRNATLILSPEDTPVSMLRVNNPMSLTINPGGALYIYDSQIIGPERGPLGGFQILVYHDADFVMMNSELKNGGWWCGDAAVAVEEGASGAVIEGNTITSSYCAVSLEGATGCQVTNNTISNCVMGIYIIGDQDHTVSGNVISKTGWKGIGGAVGIPVTNNAISDAWGVGIFPPHWGVMPEGNTFRDVRGPSLLYQDPMILTYAEGFRAFSYDSCDVTAGQEIVVYVRLAHTSPYYGQPGFPEAIEDVLTISLDVHLRVNGQIIDTERASVRLGEASTVKLTGTAPMAGTYDIKIDQIL